MSVEEFPALTQLAQAYLHQDFDLVSGSAVAAIDEFLTGEPDGASLVRAEVAQAFAAFPSEGAAREFVLSELGSYYRVEADGHTYRGWLQSIADRACELGY